MIKQLIFMGISFLMGFSIAVAENPVIKVEKVGKGNPMILIHGMACSAGVWDEVAQYYKDDYELHLVTIAGFGNNRTMDAPHVLKAIRNALFEYVKNERLDKPILMGHSMGGFISLWAAAEHPQLFGKIISVDGLPYFPVMVMPGITPETAEPIVKQMQSAMGNQDSQATRATQEMMIASMIGNESKRAKVVEMGMKSNGSVIGKAMGEMYTTDIRTQVHNIEQPVLSLGSWYGYRDWGVTMESARAGFEAQFNLIPNATVAMADTALHFIFYDQPDWFFEKVDAFLKD